MCRSIAAWEYGIHEYVSLHFFYVRVCFPVVKLSIQYSLNKADGPYAIGLCWFLFMSDLHCNAQEAVLYY
jgi:hypothetical protein